MGDRSLSKIAHSDYLGNPEPFHIRTRYVSIPKE